jgi:hypothetical protein
MKIVVDLPHLAVLTLELDMLKSGYAWLSLLL